jgi:HSP20 family protein
MDVKDIDVTVENGMLIISGERSQEKKEESDAVVRTELVYGRFYRAIPLPQGADESGIVAVMRNGTLEVVVPVSKRDRGHRVEVQKAEGQSQGQGRTQGSRS